MKTKSKRTVRRVGSGRMVSQIDACPVCRVPWTNHIGIIGTCDTVQKLRALLRKYRRGISEVLRDNAHLADGEDCTLIKLKRLLANAGDVP